MRLVFPDQAKEQNYDNIIDQTEHRAEHIKQLAHVINDLGMNEAAGRWAEGLSDSGNLEKSQKKLGSQRTQLVKII